MPWDGVPVIVPDIPARDPILVDGKNALLFAPVDAESLALQLDLLGTETGLRDRLADGAAASGRELDWTSVAEASGWTALIEGVVA